MQMSNFATLALGLRDIFPQWEWQLPALVVLIGIIIGWVMYRRKQM